MTKLITETLDNTITVRDLDGGRWWPSAEALDEIRASADPEAAALRICEEEPTRGRWVD